MNITQMRPKIIDLVRLRPGLTTVQISDSLDMDLELVEIALRDEVDLGAIRKQEVKSPNGRLALAFWLKDDPEVLPVLKEPTRVLPQAPAVPGAPLRKYDLAVACILENGGIATSAQLHAALKLKPTEYASQYLVTSIKNGALVKDGKNWTIGTPGNNPNVSKVAMSINLDLEERFGKEPAVPLSPLEVEILAVMGGSATGKARPLIKYVPDVAAWFCITGDDLSRSGVGKTAIDAYRNWQKHCAVVMEQAEAA